MKIAWFCIPAHGHTNPTLGLVKALMDAAGIDDCGKGLRFYGYFIEEEKTLVIEMTPSGEDQEGAE